MKILHITNMFEQGGVDSLLMQLLPRMAAAGHQVELLVLARKNASKAAELAGQGVPVHIGKYANVYDPRNIGQIRKLLKKGGYDLIHTHLFPTQLYAILAVGCMGKCRPAMVTTEHCTTNNRRTKRWFRPIDRFMYKHYDTVAGVCDAARDNLRQWSGQWDKIVSIPNGIDTAAFAGVKPYTNEELGLPPAARRVVMVARFFGQKDQATAVRSMQHLPADVHLLFAGSGETLEACRSLADTLGVADRVHFLGRCDDVGRVVASADIGMLSTFYEGMPISILEYFALGKPVVATDVDGVHELVGDLRLLNPPQDDRLLAGNILYLLDHPDYARQTADRNLAKSQAYTLEKMNAAYLELYNRMTRATATNARR